MSFLRQIFCSTLVKTALFVSRWAIGRTFLKEILLFHFFRTSREHFLVFSFNRFRNGRQNCILDARRTYPLRKLCRQNFFLSVPDYEVFLLEISLNYLRHGCQNYSLRVQRSSLRMLSDNEGNFLGLSLKNSRHGCQNYSLRVQRSTLRKVIFFFRIFQNCFRTLSDNRPDFWRKVSAASTKLHSTIRRTFRFFLQSSSYFI